MKKKLLSLLLLAAMAFSALAGCTPSGTTDSSAPSNSSVTESTSEKPDIDEVDYAGQVTLDENSDSLKMEVTVKQFIDGDTTHFNVPKTFNAQGILKARYIAVNTPESTGTIEPWGKKAANFTKEALESASSIIIETDGTEWEVDSTGDRYLVWVWYKPSGSSVYRNLNIEILQNGLAVGNKAGISRYGEACTSAINQARLLSLHVHSSEKDPDFYYGSAIELDLKELRTNIEEYNTKRVAFEATVIVYNDWNVWVEDYDEETGLYYGITVFYGYNATFNDILKPGNRARIVGKVSYYEAGGTYQISDLKYDIMDPDNPEYTTKISSGNDAAYTEKTITEFNANVTIEKEVMDFQTGDMILVPTTYQYCDVAISTSISMKNLTVVDAYTTSNGGNNDGAMTLTCELDGKIITVRTTKLYYADGTMVKQDAFIGKTIDVRGVIDVYDGEYQIKVFYLGAITIHE